MITSLGNANSNEGKYRKEIIFDGHGDTFLLFRTKQSNKNGERAE